MTWFQRLTGIEEHSPEQVRDHLSVDGAYIVCPNGRRIAFGRLEAPKLSELRQAVVDLNVEPRRSTICEIVGDVPELHADQANSDAMFQVASQFNLLEMTGPLVTPERGVGIYESDPTQGPACASRLGTQGWEHKVGNTRLGKEGWERRVGKGGSAWLSPVEIDERLDPIGSDVEPSGRRASRKGVLPKPLLKYLDLLDFTGRRIKSDKRGAIPVGINPILTRIGIAFEGLVNSIEELALKHQRYFESTERKGRPDHRITELELAPS